MTLLSQRRPLVIANPQSANGKTGADWRAIQRRLEQAIGPVDVRFTERAGGASQLAREAAAAGREWIIAVGGDGTVNETVNGLLSNDRPVNPNTVLSFIMRGTGNDFRRTLSGARNLEQDIARLAQGAEHTIDAGKLTFTGLDGRPQTRYFNNLASFGMSGEVDRRVNQASFAKRFGGQAAFLWGTLWALAAYRNKRCRLRIDGGPWQELDVRLAIIANGQYAGAGMRFAPGAKVDDGLFDVVLFENTSLGSILRHMPRIYQGTHLALPSVRHMKGSVIETESESEVLLDVDGEAPGKLPARFEVLPGVLRVKC